MTAAKPNHFHLCGETVFGTAFGGLHSITPRNIQGNGHDPYIHVRFTYGASLDFTPETFADLIRSGPEVLAQMPFIPEIHDAVLDQEDAL